MAKAVRREPLLLVLVLLAAAAYLAVELLRWRRFEAGGFDLGIFDQTVWHYSRFELPANSIRGLPNIWGDHFSPILMLVAPLYWIWSDARVLLIVQALVLAAAAIPIYAYARPRLGRGPAYLLAGAYLCFWGVQSGIEFDFHENAFVPVVLASLFVAADRERWGLYGAALIGLLCIKEDEFLVAIAIGVYLLSLRRWRPALATIAAGVAWYVLVVRLLIPHYAPSGDYGYFNYHAFGDTPAAAVGHAVTHPWQLVTGLFDHAGKRRTLAYLFVPFLGLSLLSRKTIVMAPMVLERFLSDRTDYWATTNLQYTLPIAALLFLATADGASTLQRRGGRRPVLVLTAAVLVANVVAALTAGQRGWKDLVQPTFYKRPVWAHDAEAALRAIPPGASVAAPDDVIVRLAHRRRAIDISRNTPPTDYVLVDVFDPGAIAVVNGGFPGISRYTSSVLATHRPVAYHHGWIVLRDRRLGPAPVPSALAHITGADAQRLRDTSLRWGFALAGYSDQLLRCVVGGAAASCYRPIGDDFRRKQSALEGVLARVRPRLSPGCAELERAAARVITSFGDDFTAIRAGGLAGRVSPGPVQRAGAALKRDDPAYVGRFVALCAPRA